MQFQPNAKPKIDHDAVVFGFRIKPSYGIKFLMIRCSMATFTLKSVVKLKIDNAEGFFVSDPLDEASIRHETKLLIKNYYR